MLVIRLQGGLGNQMFQYAFGKALAKNGETEVCYDDSSYATDSLRDREIDAWSVVLPPVPDEIKERFPRKFGGIGIAKGLLRGELPLKRIREKRPYFFDSKYLLPVDSGYYDGYWQNESYFRSVSNQLLKDFQPKEDLDNSSLEILKQINRNHSVAVHIRRGDFVNHPVHQVCDSDYYQRAIAELLSGYEAIKLFIFSDDPKWCERELSFDCPIQLVDCRRGVPPHEDIVLMQHCRHHIIPNSSFSWWGAWLKHDSSGEVFVPDRWFADPNFGGGKIAPKAWKRIPTETTHNKVRLAA